MFEERRNPLELRAVARCRVRPEETVLFLRVLARLYDDAGKEMVVDFAGEGDSVGTNGSYPVTTTALVADGSRIECWLGSRSSVCCERTIGSRGSEDDGHSQHQVGDKVKESRGRKEMSKLGKGETRSSGCSWAERVP